jgi:hypothetical protein
VGLIGLLVAIVIVGLLIWAIEQLPLPPPFAVVVRIIGIIIVILLLLQFLGIYGVPILARRC